MNKDKGKAKVLTKNQFNRVIKYQSTTRHRLRNILVMHLSVFLMMRSKEMANLKIGDVCSSDGELFEECTLKKSQTKGKKQRRFYLTNIKVIKSVTDYLKTRKDSDGKLDLHAPLITNQMSGKFSPRTMCQLFKRMYLAVGLTGNFSSHSGRRTGASKLSENGVSIHNLQTLMGHQNISTTALYIAENPTILGKITADYSL
jgi:integrase/recombinase XerD